MELGAERLSIDIGHGSVSALWVAPPDPRAVCVHGHGSGAPMTNAFHVTIAAGLRAEGIASLRYNFPYMENGTPWPDPMELAMATVAAAYRVAFDLAPAVPHFAGGKSHGGRMASNAAALGLLPHVRGVYFFAFPLLAPGVPATQRADHLAAVAAPLLFLQGTRDESAPLRVLGPVVNRLASRATLEILPGADHGLQLPGLPGQGNPGVMRAAVTALVGWMERQRVVELA